jgi:hypothetical protein
MDILRPLAKLHLLHRRAEAAFRHHQKSKQSLARLLHRPYTKRGQNAGIFGCPRKPLKLCKKMVGATGFEPATPTPPVWCATRLRYAPTERAA